MRGPCCWVFVGVWVALLTGGAAGASGTDLPRFLPNSGNSVYAATGLLRDWPEAGPRRLWQREIGWGKSAIVEVAGRAFTATQVDRRQIALCLDPQTGRTQWEHLLLAHENRHVARGPVTSPVVDGDRVYYVPYAIDGKDVWELRGPIVCLHVSDGRELWRVDGPVWGSEAAGPLIHDDLLYVGADSPEHVILAALDKHTGAVRWTTAVPSELKRELAAPASLTYQEVGGVPQVIVATYGTREVLGVHARTGAILWRYPYPVDIRIGLLSTPVAVGRRLLLSAGEGPGKGFFACLEMEAVGDGVRYHEAYRSTERQTNMYNTVAVRDGAVFGFAGQGDEGRLLCTDLATGDLLWEQTGSDWNRECQLVLADGLVLALTRGGALVLAEADRDGWTERSRFSVGFDLGRPQQPTLAQGRLYLRGNQVAACYAVAASSGT